MILLLLMFLSFLFSDSHFLNGQSPKLIFSLSYSLVSLIPLIFLPSSFNYLFHRLCPSVPHLLYYLSLYITFCLSLSVFCGGGDWTVTPPLCSETKWRLLAYLWQICYMTLPLLRCLSPPWSLCQVTPLSPWCLSSSVRHLSYPLICKNRNRREQIRRRCDRVTSPSLSLSLTFLWIWFWFVFCKRSWRILKRVDYGGGKAWSRRWWCKGVVSAAVVQGVVVVLVVRRSEHGVELPHGV